MTNIIKISKNVYRIELLDNKYIEIKLSTNLKNDPEVLLTNDMSADGIILFRKSYEMPDAANIIIGEAYQYVERKCVNKDLVLATIINTNISIEYAKLHIENL